MRAAQWCTKPKWFDCLPYCGAHRAWALKIQANLNWDIIILSCCSSGLSKHYPTKWLKLWQSNESLRGGCDIQKNLPTFLQLLFSQFKLLKKVMLARTTKIRTWTVGAVYCPYGGVTGSGGSKHVSSARDNNGGKFWRQAKLCLLVCEQLSSRLPSECVVKKQVYLCPNTLLPDFVLC